MPERAAVEQIRCEAVRIVSADRAEDQIDFRIGKRIEKILRALLGMRVEPFESRKRMRAEADVHAVRFKPPDADIELVLYARFTENASRQTHDTDGFDHGKPPYSKKKTVRSGPLCVFTDAALRDGAGLRRSAFRTARTR